MIIRIFPDKDTFITNMRKSNVPQTGSNFGASEMLHVFKKNGITSGSDGLARSLLRFDISSISSSLAAGTIPTGSLYYLKMFNAQHADTLPYSYDVEVQATSESWDEGRGLDTDYFSDKGVANWDKRKSTLWWTTTGSAGTGTISSMHFDEGDEDLLVNVGTIFGNWISGQVPNNGLMVRLSSTLETGSEEYYIKKFHSRHTNFLDRRPYIEVSWDDSVRTGTLTGISKPSEVILSMYDLKDVYEVTDEPKLHVFARDRDYNPSVVSTASSDVRGLALTKAYWSVRNERTEQVVLPFGTGSTEFTRVSYNDTDGNYFNIKMSTLAPGNVYRVVFLIESGSQRTIVDDGFKFRVT